MMTKTLIKKTMKSNFAALKDSKTMNKQQKKDLALFEAEYGNRIFDVEDTELWVKYDTESVL